MQQPATRTTTTPSLDQAQISAHGDMPVDELREALHAMADMVADYLAGVEDHPVLPRVAPGELTERLDGPAPEDPEPFATILEDARHLIVPNVTHWQHPGFMAYFPSNASGPGIIGELLMSSLVANAMLWRTSPVATELEAITVRWLREGLGLPGSFDGLYTDTASTSSLVALGAARQAATRDAAARGLAQGRPLRIYCSEEAHSSIDKAAMTLGLGRDGVLRVPTDVDRAMDPVALAAAIRRDGAEGRQPCAVVATVGTTSSTAIDPVAAVADVCAAEGLWLHVDAAYAGVVALIPERRAPFRGWERADSIVINPHKWLFAPMDCSLLLTRRMEVLRDAFSLVPEYLRTTGGAASGRDYNEYIPQLGRRPRAIKMWMLLRYFGLSGLRARIEEHIALAVELADRVDQEPDAERLAPVPFSTVCFRWRPARLAGRTDDPGTAQAIDSLNERLLAELNASGRVFLSHTRLEGRYAIRVAVGNLRTERHHLVDLWERVRSIGSRLAAEL